jgi:DNA replication and repair protein RecF
VRLRSLAQLNARNLRTPRIDFPDGVIAVVGRNAAGKSNLLEAAYLGCTGELPAGRVSDVVRHGQQEGYVAVEVEHDEGVSRVEVGLAPGRKHVRLDGQHARALDVARVVTAVLLTPEDADLVHGAPSGRRGYLDGLLTRLSARYALLLREYLRVVEQRNALLRVAQGRHDASDPTLPAWTDRFLRLGSEIDALRDRAVTRLAPLAADVYRDVAGCGDLGLALTRAGSGDDLAEALAAAGAEERARGVTPVGPHRDDLAITLDGHDLRTFGSRGEARTAALALRTAEYRLLSEKHGEPPVLLIDDFTAELDAHRRAYLLALTAGTPQALVTGTEAPPRHDALFTIADGEVRRA